MMPKQQFSRVDTLELKTVIVRKVGIQKAERYFDYLRRLFTLKVSKREFDRFCIRTLGKENISLHNRLIGSILKNAHIAKVPPFKGRKSGQENDKFENGTHRNLQSLYGDAFPLSPRKGRSVVNRDCRFRDRPSPLGPQGKPQSITCQEQQSATELLSLGSRPPVEVASVEDGEEVEQAAGSPGIQSRSPVTAPLGVSVNVGGARKVLNGFTWIETCLNRGELPDTRSLRTRLARKLETEGIDISVDSVDLLNNGLDVFLKRLIEPCLGLSALRSKNVGIRQLTGHALPGLTSTYASMLEFRSVMEMNPQILGGDSATQLEKICCRSWEE